MLGNKTYRVNKPELLTCIKKNREKHIAEFNEAQTEYRKRAAMELEQRLQNVLAGKPFSLHFRLVPPRSHAAEYDKVIGLLEMSLDDTIEITSTDYSQYVLDEWSWKQDFSSTVNAYKAGNNPDEE